MGADWLCIMFIEMDLYWDLETAICIAQQLGRWFGHRAASVFCSARKGVRVLEASLG